MAGRRSSSASRAAAFARFARWAMLAVAGAVIGLILGDRATPGRLVPGGTDGRTYSTLSANPDALPVPGSASVPCYDCPDSYGAAAQLRGARRARSDEALRDLGSVELDWPVPMPDDDYRYGGRFPDPEPLAGADKATVDTPHAAGAIDEGPAEDEPPPVL